MTLLSVAANAIPLDRAEECFSRVGPTRYRLMNELETAYERFVDSEADMRFLHTRTVEDTKQCLADLIAAAQAYSANLNWKL